MKKTLIAGAVVALVSTGAFAAKPIKPKPARDLTPRVEALESDVKQLQADTIANSERILELELSAGEKDYTVYDATGRAVGTTKNGEIIIAEFEGHDAVFHLGGDPSADPDYSNSGMFDGVGEPNHVFFVDDSCMGEPLMYAGKYVGRKSLLTLKPVTEEIVKLEDGSYIYPDKLTPALSTAVQSMWTLGYGCGPSSPFDNVLVAPAKVLHIDWVPPVTVEKP